METKRNRSVLYVFTFVFFALFYYFLPLAGDDWTWGSAIGMERFKNGFDGYNGRYVGNLLIILITRSVMARVVICTAVMFLLIYVLGRIFDTMTNEMNTDVNYLIAFSSVLILILPNQIAFGKLQPFQIFGSTVSWFSGFTNYVFPSVLILIYYYLVICKKSQSAAINIFLFLNGILACLCVEHYTLFCLFFGFLVLVYRFRKYKAICKKSLLFFLGSCLGAAIMFSNSSYQSMQKGNTGEKLRSVGFLGSIRNYYSFLFPNSGNRTCMLLFEAGFVLVISGILLLFLRKAYRALKNDRVGGFIPVICMVVTTLPLLVTNSGKEIYLFAPRCYFLQYFMLVIFLYGKCVEKTKVKEWIRIKPFCLGLSLCFSFLMFVTCVKFAELDYWGILRERTVNRALQSGSSTVQIIKYPKNIGQIQWSSNFITVDVHLDKYILMKKIPDYMKVEIIEY